MSKQIMARSILALLMLFPLSSCYTIYNWSDGPPSNPTKLNAEQKKRLFKRYAILRIQGNRVTTEAEPDKFYSLSSFTPVMERVSPEAKGPLEKARTMETMVTVGNTLTAIGALATVNTFSSYLITDNSTRQVINYVGWGTWAAGIVTSLVFGMFQQQASDDAQRAYVKGLNDYIYRKSDLSWRPEPTLVILDADGSRIP